MRTILLHLTIMALVMRASAAWAAHGFDTNLITFTNRTGWVSNAMPVRIDSGRLIYRTESGGGSIRMTELPEALRAKFGYDEAQAQADAERERETRQRQSEVARMQAVAQTEVARLRGMESNAVVIYGKIIQRLDDKLLVNADSQLSGDWTTQSADSYFHKEADKLLKVKLPKHWRLARGTLLLADYPKSNLLVDGDLVQVVAYPSGTYSYVAVSGGKKTVRRYTADIRMAFVGGD